MISRHHLTCRSWLALWLVVGVLATAACEGGSKADDRPSTPPPSSETPRSPQNTADGSDDDLAPLGGRKVVFRAADGVRITGAMFGHGPVTVVLAHMGRGGDQAVDWVPFARVLAARGYRALIFNRRGICSAAPHGGEMCSGGVDDLAAHWKDVVGAVHFLRSHNVQSVVVGGASIGAMATMRAVLVRRGDVDGVIWFAGLLDGDYTFTPREISQLAVPVLILSSRDDGYGAADAAKTLSEWIGGSQPVILPGSAHGTDIFVVGPAEARQQFRVAVLDFLTRLP